MVEDNINELGCATPESIYSVLVAESQKFEQDVGLKNICEFVDSHLKPNESLSFIDSYRDVIRLNTWNYEDNVETDYPDFLSRWQTTHVMYIDSASKFLKYLMGDDKSDFSQIHALAIASETFRGREGKRSKIGLDNIFDTYIKKLSNLVEGVVPSLDLDETVGLFASHINKPFVSAEHELFLDYYKYSHLVEGDLSLEKVLEIDAETQGLCSKILREYCKYSIADFNKKKKLLDLSDGVLETKSKFQSSLLNERNYLQQNIYSSLLNKSGRCARDFLLILDRINCLNYMNSNLEVKLSFKGWPGLFHHFIFEKGKVESTDKNLYARQSNIEFKEMRVSKWNQYKS